MAGTATVREADLADCASAEAVLGELGIGVARDPADAPRWWDWIWTRNPARMPGRHHPPPGWVLEVDGEIQGFFGNLPGRYRLGDDTLIAAVASHWAVRKPFRGHTPRLADAYFSQTGPDLLLVSTGIAATGRIFARHGAVAMPLAEYQRVLFWVLDPAHFAASALRRRGHSAQLARAASMALAPALAAWSVLRQRAPGRPSHGIEPEEIPLDAIGDEFDELWRAKCAEARRLLAYRGAQDLRWHFEPRAERVSVLRCRRGGRLAGYLVLLREAIPEIGLDRLKIVDLLAAGDDPAVIDALLAAAWERSRELGAHVLELVGFPHAVRCRAERSRPLARRYATQPFHFRARPVELHDELQTPDRWYPSLYDGDGCLGSI